LSADSSAFKLAPQFGLLGGLGLGVLVGAGEIAVGTLVAPGVGTIGGAVVAVPTIGAFAVGGTVVGAIGGAIVGGYLGYQYCSGGGEPMCGPPPMSPAIPMPTPTSIPPPATAALAIPEGASQKAGRMF
jgi:hypothetical protein